MFSFSTRTISGLSKYNRPVQWICGPAYSTATNQDFLHESIVPTDHFQKSLPRLRIPKLENTCERYLKSQRPILNDNEFQSTEKLVAEFKEGPGKALHDELVAKDKANKHTSYISGPWYDMYLRDRRPVVFNHTPFMSFNDDSKAEYNVQDVKATNFIIGALKFAKTLRAGVLEPMVYHLNASQSDNLKFRKFVRMLPKSVATYGAYWYKAFPLDMSQFPRLFNGTRIPRPDKDEIFTDPSGTHMVVQRNGHFYTFEALDKDGNIKSAAEILSYIRYILSDTIGPAEYPVGMFTTLDRDTWTTVRQKLEQSGNGENLKQIDRAWFALNLDDCVATDAMTLARNFLHGDGTNRWFDKSFSIIIQKDARATINFEHSWGDGVAVLRLMDELYKYSTESPSCHPDTQPASTDAASEVKRLSFNLTDEIKSDLKSAEEKFKSTVARIDMSYIQIHDIGKNFIKSHKVGPDSFMQLAIQLAFYRQHREFVATYESCSTSAFLHGRTETLRSNTIQTKQACELFEKPDVSPEQLLGAIKECSTVHNQLTKEAAMGNGWDRHLFAMRYLAAAKGETPMLFQDPNYIKINQIILSTSTLTSPAVQMGGFGAVVPNGYGCGYSCHNDNLGFIVSCYKEHRNVQEFLDIMKGVILDLQNVLEGKKPSHGK